MQTSPTTVPSLHTATIALLEHVLAYTVDRNVLIVRHGNTTKAQPGEDDNVRVLSDKGLEQCAAARAVYALHRPKLVICTGARRTAQTAQEVFPAPVIAIAPGMYPFDEPVVNAIFNAEGNVPATRYLDGGWNPNPWLQRALSGTLEVLHVCNEPLESALTFVNHGAFGPTLAWSFAEYLGVDTSIPLTVQLGEVEGLLVTPKGVQHLMLI